jgi:hypothetical protein
VALPLTPSGSTIVGVSPKLLIMVSIFKSAIGPLSVLSHSS